MSPPPPPHNQKSDDLRKILQVPEDWQLSEQQGIGPFTSRLIHRLPDGTRHAWESRRHRKRRCSQLISRSGQTSIARASEPGAKARWLWFWAPDQLTWWIAVVFSVGSALFLLGATASLWPDLFETTDRARSVTNLSYFIGAVGFTVAIYIQLLETINTPQTPHFLLQDLRRSSFRWIAWQPYKLSYLSTAILLGGSFLFNIETSFALISSTFSILEQDLLLSLPSFIGSIGFVISSYLALTEVCHRYWCWQPRDISWWITVLNLIGSGLFWVGSTFGFEIPGLSDPRDEVIVGISFWLGSVLFLVGSLLMFPEMSSE